MSDTIDCFISYASGDLDLAQALNEKLIQAKFKVWFDKARLNPGCDWHKEIEQGCENARVILPVLTPSWKKSEWARYETYGHDAVIPVLFGGDWDAVKTGPLSRWQFHDLRNPDDGKWKALVGAIRALLAVPAPVKAERILDLRYPPNPYFVGRDEKLLEICEELHAGQTAALTQGKIRAITALGGVGKTTLASEYIHRFWRLYPQIFWVDARSGYEPEFARIHDLLFPARAQNPLPPCDKAKAALRELSGLKPRLLVIDNAENEITVRDWIPKSGACHTLITSRFADWSAAVKSIPVYVLEAEPAREFLQSRSQHVAEGDELAACDALAKRLGYLPLALEIAAAYIEQQGEKFGFGDYLRLFEAATAELLSEKRLGSTDYPDPLIATWKSSVDKLTPDARAILRVCSCMAGTPLPFDVFVRNAQTVRDFAGRFGVSAPIASPLMSELRMRQAVAALKAYSLSRFDGVDLQFHTLVQTVEWLNAAKPEQDAAAGCAVTILDDAFPDVSFKNWPLCDELSPHAERAIAVALDSVGDPLTHLLNQTACYLRERAQFTRAELLHRRSLKINEARHGPNDSAVACDLNNLAAVFLVTDRLAEAEQFFRRALGIWHANYGPKHPDATAALNNLATVLADTNRPGEAEPLLRQALEIIETSLGADTPNAANCLNNLANLCRSTNRFGEAEQLYRRALRIDEAMLGASHPDVARDLHNLSCVLAATNRSAEAEPICRRALKTIEEAVGNDHPRVANYLKGLAELLVATNRRAEAEPLYRRALKILEESFGQDHLQVGTCLSDLAGLLADTNRIAEAEMHYRRAANVIEASLGPNHPKVAVALNNLAELFRNTNRLAEAEQLYRRALKIEEASYGPDHPDVATSLNNLGLLLVATDRIAEAEPLYRRALKIDEASYGPDHPDVARDLNNLALLLSTTNRFAEAETLFHRAWRINETSFGPDHPKVAVNLNNLAHLLQHSERFSEAEPLVRRALKIDETSYGPHHPTVAIRLQNLAILLCYTGRIADAEPLLRRALKILEKSFGLEHPQTLMARKNLAAVSGE